MMRCRIKTSSSLSSTISTVAGTCVLPLLLPTEAATSIYLFIGSSRRFPQVFVEEQLPGGRELPLRIERPWSEGGGVWNGFVACGRSLFEEGLLDGLGQSGSQN